MKKSCAVADGLAAIFFKMPKEKLALPISNVINQCLKQVIFTSIWKKANIIPIRKQNGEYRPISHLPFLAKLFEIIIRDTLIQPYMINSLSKSQYAFIPNSYGGVTNALLDIRLSVLQHLSANHKGSVSLLSIDFSKAFDSVCHEKLLQTLLNEFMLPHRLITLIQSFVSNRVQRVKSGDYLCSWKNVTSGVPQGSVLGPILFAIYINSIFYLGLDNCKTIGYADDIFVLFYNNSLVRRDIQDTINLIIMWCSSKFLKINPSKTKIITFHRSHLVTQPPQIFVGDVVIEEVKEIKILGVIFQHDIKWDHEFKSFWPKIYRAMSMCRRVKNAGAPTNIIRSAFYGLVFPLLAFRWPLICDGATKYINKVLSLSKRASILCKEEINLMQRLDQYMHKAYVAKYPRITNCIHYHDTLTFVNHLELVETLEFYNP